MRMNKKQLIVGWAMATLLLSYALLFAEEFNPFPENIGSSYEYSSDNIPEVCFFPLDKARWDGSKITPKEWVMLTDFQKTMFISEFVNVYHEGLEINGWDYLRYLNQYVAECQDERLNDSMAEILEIFLLKKKKIKQ